MGHESLDPSKDKEYWEFSFTEMGIHDAPAQVDYVRQKTNTEKVTFIGHSQGTSQMFYALSVNQDFWKERLNLFVALAPVTNLANTRSDLFKYTAGSINVVAWALNLGHIYEILSSPSDIATEVTCGLIPQFCKLAEGFLIT